VFSKILSGEVCRMILLAADAHLPNVLITAHQAFSPTKLLKRHCFAVTAAQSATALMQGTPSWGGVPYSLSRWSCSAAAISANVGERSPVEPFRPVAESGGPGWQRIPS